MSGLVDSQGRIDGIQRYISDWFNQWIGKIGFVTRIDASHGSSADTYDENTVAEAAPRELEADALFSHKEPVRSPQEPNNTPLDQRSYPTKFVSDTPVRKPDPVPQPVFTRIAEPRGESRYGSYLPDTAVDTTATAPSHASERRKRLAEQLRRKRKSELRFGAARYSAAKANSGEDAGFYTPASSHSGTQSDISSLETTNLSSVHPYRSSNRVVKYRSPFKKLLANGERLQRTVSSYGPDSVRNSVRLVAVRNRLLSSLNHGLSSPFKESMSPAAPIRSVRHHPLPSHMSDSQSVDELLKQLIKEGNATDFPSWKAIQLRRTERAKAIQELRQPKREVILPLSATQLRKVEEHIQIRDPNRTLASAFRIDISVGDIRTLGDRQWLNDNVIDFYLAMITQRSKDRSAKDTSYPRSFAFTTHFFTTLSGKGYQGVARWGKRKQLDLANIDYIFVPINVHNTHWCVSVINILKKRFEYYDSLGGGAGNSFKYLREYIENEAKTQGVILDVEEWAEYVSRNSPMQENGYDCGVFACKTVEVLSRNGGLTFSQRDMGNLRRRMIYEILESRLLT